MSLYLLEWMLWMGYGVLQNLFTCALGAINQSLQ